jgi:hypothetical protein
LIQTDKVVAPCVVRTSGAPINLSKKELMIKTLLGALVALFVVVPAPHAQGGSPQPQLVGLPVFAATGSRSVGSRTYRCRMVGLIKFTVSTGAALGFGECIVTVPQPAFMIKGDMVLIPDLSARS